MVIQLPENEEQQREVLQYLRFAQIPFDEVDTVAGSEKQDTEETEE
jgi:hypothetical protein